MARPRIDQADQRNGRLNLRLTSAERLTIEANAAFFGLSPSEFMRRRSLERRMPAAKTDQKGIALAATALIRVGNNLNQLTRHANAGTVMEQSLLDTLARVNACLDQLYDPSADGSGRELQGSGVLLPR